MTAHTVPAGESSKCAARLAELWEAMMAAGLTRTDAVAALGGGVVGDLAGFAAATILRGVDFVQIPTTLLAQVDSSVGGKVAVDLEHGKNLAGAFWQPRLVLMDPEVLDTLPLPVFMEGMAEVVKYGCIRDAAFFDFLAARPSRAELMAEMEHILYTCCAIKRSVVEQDERDTGSGCSSTSATPWATPTSWRGTTPSGATARRWPRHAPPPGWVYAWG
ncbi:3-dehydroquinate synthase [Flavonifractor plautii]|nr:3-dehydroquinate synthase [Flavonifractor plautii]